MFYVVLSNHGEDAIYEVTRDEQKFLLDYFETYREISDGENGFWALTSRRRTQPETASKKGRGNKIPDELRKVLTIVGLPRPELKAPVWKLGDKIITTFQHNNPKERRLELLKKGAIPYKPQPGDVIFRHENDETPLGIVRKQ